MSALLEAIKRRDPDEALRQLATLCKMDNPPQHYDEETAWTDVFHHYASGILRGNWEKVSSIRSEGYFHVVARRHMWAIQRSRPRHLLSEAEWLEAEGYEDDFDDDDGDSKPLSSVDRVRAMLNFSSRDVFDWLVAQGKTERYRFQHGDCQRIADELGVHRNSVTKALKDIKQAWRCL